MKRLSLFTAGLVIIAAFSAATADSFYPVVRTQKFAQLKHVVITNETPTPNGGFLTNDIGPYQRVAKAAKQAYPNAKVFTRPESGRLFVVVEKKLIGPIELSVIKNCEVNSTFDGFQYRQEPESVDLVWQRRRVHSDPTVKTQVGKILTAWTRMRHAAPDEVDSVFTFAHTLDVTLNEEQLTAFREGQLNPAVRIAKTE